MSLALWLCALAGAPAQAAGPELLVPQPRVPESGLVVAAATPSSSGWIAPEGRLTLTARGGRVTPLAPDAGLPRWKVIPERGVRELLLSLGGAPPVRLPVGPPASEVTLQLEPSAPVKGRDREATLTVKLLDGAGKPWAASAPPVLRASVGSVEDVRAVGPGIFQARYVLPTTRFPEVAVVVAFAPWPHADADTGAMGGLRVALSTAIDLPGRSEPGAAISLQVGGVDFGPVTVGSDGRFAIPVVVPPGEGQALSTVQDRHGNRRRERIDLRLPPVDPLACVVNPPRLPSDGSSRARILCGLSDVRARAVDSGRITLKAQHGSLEGPVAAGDGLVGFRYTAPAKPFGRDALEARARLRGALGKESLIVVERDAPATTLAVSSSEPILHRGGRTTLTVKANDAGGRGVSGARVQASATVGELEAVRFDDAGVAHFGWSAPRTSDAAFAEVHLDVTGPTGTVPARLYSWVSGARLWLAVGDPAGLPVPDASLRVGDRGYTTDDSGRVSLPLPQTPIIDVVHGEWSELRVRLYRIASASPSVFPDVRPTDAQASLRLPLGPELPVNVRLQLDGRRVRYWAEHPGGARVPDRELAVRSSAGPLPTPQQEPDGSRVVALPEGGQLITVSDVRSGVTAAARVAP